MAQTQLLQSRSTSLRRLLKRYAGFAAQALETMVSAKMLETSSGRPTFLARWLRGSFSFSPFLHACVAVDAPIQLIGQPTEVGLSIQLTIGHSTY